MDINKMTPEEVGDLWDKMIFESIGTCYKSLESNLEKSWWDKLVDKIKMTKE